MQVHAGRVHRLRSGTSGNGPVLYWMSRDQRVEDNWALLFAQQAALERKTPLGVVFTLAPRFLSASARHYAFMLAGLREVESGCRERGIGFTVLTGPPEKQMSAYCTRYGASLLVADFDPLRIKRGWRESVAQAVDIPFYEVDAHNIVPCRVASDKQEYGAYTLRPKIHKRLEEFLENFPAVEPHPVSFPEDQARTDWDEVRSFVAISGDEHAGLSASPGAHEAARVLEAFIGTPLNRYDEQRNDPSLQATSHLSPYLHFGQLASQRVALAVQSARGISRTAKDAFLEELIVRKELSDNFCLYNPRYDSVDGAPEWARQTLDEHAKDKREHLYTEEELERGETHDDLWNAAQMEMVHTGRMHGYMRMYWAKKILEWSPSPEEALRRTIFLNDRYELDGREPNGYVGAMWSICGVHDRAWKERPVFGKIRYMNRKGCERKFDVAAYIALVRDKSASRG